jgi:hypothetical protein
MDSRVREGRGIEILSGREKLWKMEAYTKKANYSGVDEAERNELLSNG